MPRRARSKSCFSHVVPLYVADIGTMSVRALWCLGVVVVAAMLRSLPVESQCTTKYCYNDDETVDLNMLLNIQQELSSMKEEMALMKGEMASMKGEMASMKGHISSPKDNLTKLSKCCIILRSVDGYAGRCEL